MSGTAQVGAGGATRLTHGQVITYGLADFAQMCVAQFTALYVLYFYTDLVGLSGALVGTVFMLSRVWDGINDPIMGVIIDRTRTRRGRCIPYMLPASVVFSLATLGLFIRPDLSGIWLATYFIVLYNAFSMAFTALNLPLTAVLPLLTTRHDDRVRLSSARAMFGAFAYAGVPIAAEWLIARLGGHEREVAFTGTSVVLGLMCIGLFVVATRVLRERVVEETARFSVASLRPIFWGNRPWMIVLVANILISSGLIARFTAGIYFFRIVVEDMRWFGLFMSLSTLAMVPIALIAPWLVARMGKPGFAALGCAVATVGNVLILMFPHDAMLLLVGGAVSGVAAGAFLCVLFAMEADIADDVFRRTGLQAQGLVCAAVALGYKIALGLGSAIVGWSLSASGYVAGATAQAPAVGDAIIFCFGWFPLVCVVVSIPILLAYRIPTLSEAPSLEPAEAPSGA